MRSLVLAATGTAALSLAACGTSTIDAAKGEQEISKAVRVQAGVPVKEVACPENVKIEKGGTFTCTVTAKDGTSGSVDVVQKDEDGNVSFDAPFIHMDEAEASIITQIEEQVPGAAGQVSVDCPDIVVGKKGAPFECDGKAGKETFTVKATQTDGQGRFRFTTKQTS
ncbi:MAG: DUF4333 domain-containing protein [Baekduia sp.]